MQFWMQKYRQMGFGQVGRKALMRNTETKEAGKSERFDRWISVFKQPAEYFRAHVYAESHLQCRALRYIRGSGNCEDFGYPPLCRTLNRLLQNHIDAVVQCRFDWQSIGAKRLFPLAGDL